VNGNKEITGSSAAERARLRGHRADGQDVATWGGYTAPAGKVERTTGALRQLL